MQQGLAGFAAGMPSEHLAAKLAQIFKPWAQVIGQLRVNLAAQALGHGGTFSAGGDGHLQAAAADH
jgi:hypothetical protein